MAVGLEFGLARPPHMVHDEDCADAGEDRPQQKMRAGEIKRIQSARITLFAELLHQSIMTGWLGWASEASEKPLKKQLAGPLTAPHLCGKEFRFDSLATV
jgi:hypothetical protein